MSSGSNSGGLVLNYYRETQEARFATPARRMYGYVSAGVVVAAMALSLRVWHQYGFLAPPSSSLAFLTAY